MAYWLKLEKALEVYNLLAKGQSIRQVERATKVHRNTIMRLQRYLRSRAAQWKTANEKANS